MSFKLYCLSFISFAKIIEKVSQHFLEPIEFFMKLEIPIPCFDLLAGCVILVYKQVRS